MQFHQRFFMGIGITLFMTTENNEQPIEAAYLEVLGRPVDEDGKKTHLNAMKYRSIDEIKQVLRRSPEYRDAYKSIVDGKIGKDVAYIDENGNGKIVWLKPNSITISVPEGRLYEQTLNTPHQTQLSINFYPVAVPRSGYGILGENIYKALKNYGYGISQSINYDLPAVDISLHLSIPPSWRRMESTVNIGYTMFEASRIPDSWVPFCNLMDRLIVPLKANINVFRSCGVKIPIDVVPIGVDEIVYNPCIPYHSPPMPKSFKFLIINDGQSRKNNEMVVSAFQDEFKEEISKNLSHLITRTPGSYTGKNVVWSPQYLEDPGLAALINACDCMIGASCGEAGDIPVMEGMAMEKPVIVSREMAHSEYITDGENGIFVEGSVVPAFTHPQYKGLPYLVGIHDATWILPNYNSLKEKMRWVYENRSEAEKIGKNAREYILKYRTLEVCIKQMIQIFEKYGRD